MFVVAAPIKSIGPCAFFYFRVGAFNVNNKARGTIMKQSADSSAIVCGVNRKLVSMSKKAPPSTRIPKTGAILVGRAKFTCVVASLSGFGAALDVIGSTESIPDQFDLTVTSEISVRRCAVVWRKGRRLAVAFY